MLRKFIPAIFASILLLLLTACGGQESPGPLKIGVLLYFSETSATGRSHERQQGFDLAIKHVNAAGGVFGQPVETVAADSTLDPQKAAAEAKRLIEEEGVHAIVGPSSSANSLVVGQKVAAVAGIPVISPSATSPMLSNMDDGGFFFRTALSDTAQGPVLARVTRERGFDNVGVLYRNDAWGNGLAESFADAWTGKSKAVAIEPQQATYLSQLRESASDGTQALVLIVFESEAEIILRESVESGLYDKFTFGDAAKSPELPAKVGVGHLAGMYGTAGATAQDNPSSQAFDAAYAAEYGGLTGFAYVREAYDAAMAIALAAQAAGSTDGAAIRDQLRSIGSAPGEKTIAGLDGVASALRILAEGKNVDYEGAAVTLDWDENGDITRGHIGVWRFTEDGGIEELEAVPFGFTGN